MPTEYCVECRDQHHGKSCRYGKCLVHCDCTQVERREWRTFLATYDQACTTSRCLYCARATSHICRQFTATGFVVNRKMCSEHCPDCKRDEDGDIAKCHEEFREYATLPRICCSCHEPAFIENNNPEHPELVYCRGCRDGYQCRGCYGIVEHPRNLCARCARCPYVAPEDEEDESQPYCCTCVERVSTRPQLYNEGGQLYRGYIYNECEVPIDLFINPLKRSIGVEIEVAGFRKPKRKALAHLYNTCVQWHAPIGTDGSLRDPTNTRSSVEIRTSPASGDALVMQLSDILGAIRRANGVVNTSCGLHVHVNVADAIQEIRKNEIALSYSTCLDTFIRIWQYVERELYNIVSPSRVSGSQYARPWHMKAGSNHLFTLMQARNYIDRYSGVNLEAIRKYKTVEFRLHHGCLNTRMVTAWAMLCGTLVEVCVQGHGSESLITFAKDHPKEFIAALCMNKNTRAYLGYGSSRWNVPRYQDVIRRAA